MICVEDYHTGGNSLSMVLCYSAHYMLPFLQVFVGDIKLLSMSVIDCYRSLVKKKEVILSLKVRNILIFLERWQIAAIFMIHFVLFSVINLMK